MSRACALLGGLALTLAVTGVAVAGFSNTASAAHSVTTKRIFSGARTVAAHSLSDVSSGVASSKDDTTAFADTLVDTTNLFTTAFGSTRFLLFDYNAPLPSGVPVTGATFNFRIIPNASADQACYYFEVRRISTNALLGTHFSSGSPQCVTGTTYNTISTSVSAEVTTTDIANDLRIQVYGKESANAAFKVDMATVTLTMTGSAMTLYEKAYNDQANGTAFAGPALGLDAVDALTYTNTTSWATTYSSTKYVQFGFPANIPTGATVTSVVYNRSWKSNGSPSTCYYFEVYSGATLLATHGSTSTNINCATTSYVNDHTTLAEVNTVALANSVVIRVYEKATAAAKSIDDLGTLTITYSLT